MGLAVLLKFTPVNSVIAQENWFDLTKISGVSPIIVNNGNSYTEYKLKYVVRKSPLKPGDIFYRGSTKISVSERTNGGDWSDPVEVDGGRGVTTTVNAGANNHGTWTNEGVSAGVHGNFQEFKFVPNTSAINENIPKGSQVEVRLRVKLFRDDGEIDSEDHIVAIVHFGTAGFGWEDDNNPEISVGGTSTYGEIDGLMSVTPAITPPLRYGGSELDEDGTETPATVTTNRNVSDKFPGNDIQVGPNFTYGHWVVSRNNDKFFFKPDSVEINKLTAGESITSTLEVVSLDNAGDPVGTAEKISVQIRNLAIEAAWNSEVSLNLSSQPEIVSNPGSTSYADVEGTIVKGFSPVPADENKINTWKLESFETGTPTAVADITNWKLADSQTVEAVSNYTGAEFSASTNNQYGVWYISSDRTKFLFRPKASGMELLAAGETVTAYLRISTGTCASANNACSSNSFTEDTDPVVLSIKLVGNKPIVSIQAVSQAINKSQMAQFKISVDNNPRAGFGVIVIPRNVTNSYLDEENGASGDQRTLNNLAFSLNSNTNEYEATFSLATVGKLDKYEGEGEISVGLVATESYGVNQNAHTANVTVNDHINTISVGFTEDSLSANLSTYNSRVILKLEMSVVYVRDVTVNYSIDPVPPTSQNFFNDPNDGSIVISSGMNTGEIRIDITGNSSERSGKSFKVELDSGSISPAVEGLSVAFPNNSVSTVTFSGGTYPTISKESTECSTNQIPMGITPLAQVNFESVSKPVYVLEGSSFSSRLVFTNPRNDSPVDLSAQIQHSVNVYDIDGRSRTINESNQPNQSGVDISLPAASSTGSGYTRYRIIPSGANQPNQYLSVGQPCEFHVWWVSADRPGITLSIDDSFATQKSSFTIRATATPTPNRPITIPIVASVGDLISNSENLSISIPSGSSTGTVEVNTLQLPANQTSSRVEFSAMWSNSYWLDDSRASDSVTVTSTVIAQENWFDLTKISGVSPIIVNNGNSYTPYKLKYVVRKALTKPGGGFDFGSTKISVSERTDGGDWSDPLEVAGSRGTTTTVNAGVSNHGTWNNSGSSAGIHGNFQEFAFVPNTTALNENIPKGSQIEVRLRVKMFQGDTQLHSEDHIVAIVHFGTAGIAWEEDSNPVISVDGTSIYGDIDGLMSVTPAITPPLRFGGSELDEDGTATPATVSNNRDVSAKYPGNEIQVGSNFTYGHWVVSRNNDKFFFKPDSDAINKITPGNSATSTLEVVSLDNAGNAVGTAEKITVQINRTEIHASWNSNVLLNANGQPEIVSSPNRTTYEDLEGTIVKGFAPIPSDQNKINTWRFESFEAATPTEVADILNWKPADGQTVEAVSSFTGAEFSASTNNQYGVWYVSSDRTKFLFRPKPSGMLMLSAGETVTAHLRISTGTCDNANNACSPNSFAVDTDPVVLSVSLVGKKPTISIQSVTQTINKGELAQFKISADRQPPAGFVLVIIPRNVVNSYLHEGNGASGEQRTLNNLAFNLNSSTNEYEASFPMPTIGQSNELAGIGEISVELVATSAYEINQNARTANITVNDPTTSLKVGFTDDSVDVKTIESEEGVELSFIMSGTFSEDIELSLRFDSGTAVKNRDFREPTSPAIIETGRVAATISIPIIANDGIEPTENFSVTITTLSNSDVGLGTNIVAKVSIIDSDRRSLSIFAETPQIVEGEDAVFSIYTTVAVTAGHLQIPIEVSQDGDFLFTVPRAVRLGTNVNSTRFSLLTTNNTRSNVGGEIAVTIEGPVGYTVVEPTATVRISNKTEVETTPKYSVVSPVITRILLNNGGNSNLTPPHSGGQLPSIQISSEQSSVIEGNTINFIVSAQSGSIENHLTVKVELTEVGSFIGGEALRSVSLSPIQPKGLVSVATIDDEIAEIDGAVSAIILPENGYVPSMQNRAVVSVIDSTDREERRLQIHSMHQAILPDLSASMGAGSLNLATTRINRSYSGTDQLNLRFGGQSTIEELLTAGGEAINENNFDWRAVLGESSAEVSLFSEEGVANSGAAWAYGTHKVVSDSGRLGGDDWTGDVFTGRFGFDSKLGQNSVLGLSAAFVEADAKYQNNSSDLFKVGFKNSGLYPYLGLSTPDGNFKMQTITGFGSGQTEIDQQDYDTLRLNNSIYTAAVGFNRSLGSGDLFFDETEELSISGESWMVRQNASASEQYIGELSTFVRQSRLSVDGSKKFALESGIVFIPSVSLSLKERTMNSFSRVDVEFGSRFDFENPIGWKNTATGQILIGGSDSIQELNFINSLEYNHEFDSRGLGLQITAGWGDKTGEEIQPLWSSELVSIDSILNAKIDGLQLESHVSYGLELGNQAGFLTPYGGIVLYDDGTFTYNLGSRLSINPNFDFEFSNSAGVKKNGNSSDKIRVGGRVTW